MNKNSLKPVSFAVLSIIFVITLITISSRLLVSRKTMVYGEGLWPDLSFEEFLQNSDVIVYGKVIAFEKEIIKESKINEAVTSRQVYTPVNIEVIEWIKGEKPLEAITFYQPGGETETHIYVDKDMNPLSKGEYVLLFLNEKGGRILPESVMKTDNGNVIVPPKMLSPKVTENIKREIEIYEYIKFIEESLTLLN